MIQIATPDAIRADVTALIEPLLAGARGFILTNAPSNAATSGMDDLMSAAYALAEPYRADEPTETEYEAAAIANGWERFDGGWRTGLPGGGYATEATARAACDRDDENGMESDFDITPTRFYAITPELADTIERAGPGAGRVDREFAGLIVWATTQDA